jgi:hypothetical protein
MPLLWAGHSGLWGNKWFRFFLPSTAILELVSLVWCTVTLPGKRIHVRSDIFYVSRCLFHQDGKTKHPSINRDTFLPGTSLMESSSLNIHQIIRSSTQITFPNDITLQTYPQGQAEVKSWHLAKCTLEKWKGIHINCVFSKEVFFPIAPPMIHCGRTSVISDWARQVGQKDDICCHWCLADQSLIFWSPFSRDLDTWKGAAFTDEEGRHSASPTSLPSCSCPEYLLTR